MTVFQKAKQCTKAFPCRFRAFMLLFIVAIGISVVLVTLFAN